MRWERSAPSARRAAAAIATAASRGGWCCGEGRGRRRAASAVLDAGRKRAGMAEPTVASLPALDAGSRAGGAGRVSVGREHAAHSRGALSAAGSGAAVEERGEPPGGAAGGRLPGLAEARPGRRTDRVSLPGCDLPEGAPRGQSRLGARAGGAGGARRRGEGAAELGHGWGGAHGSMGGLLENLVARKMGRPRLVITDGNAGLAAALGRVWPGVA